jgi:putative ABC transport system permease protein
MPALTGAGIGLLLLFGFGLPPLLRLRGCRRCACSTVPSPPCRRPRCWPMWRRWRPACCWRCRSPAIWKLALWVLGGLAALAVAAGAVGFVLLQLLRGLQHRLHGNWRLGLAALTRRRLLAVMQLVGLSLSLCALLLLAVTGPGLLQQWRDACLRIRRTTS